MPTRFTLRQLEYFVAVGEVGSISAASEVLNVSSPSISAAISQLEMEFGLDLFVRKHAQGLSLTPAGMRLLDQARTILRETDLLSSLAGEISGNVQGPMNIGCLVTFAQIVLPKLRREFELKYPDVRISQRELNQTEIFSHLRRADLDVALTYDLDIPVDLEFQHLLELPPFVLVSEDHPLANLSAVSVDELKEHAMILLDLPMSSDYFMSFFTPSGIKPKIAERTKDMAVMRSMVANGFGYSIANIKPLYNTSPDGGKLVFIPLTGNVRSMNMGLVTAKGANTTSTMQAFVEHCKDMIDNNKIPAIQDISQ
ncbi:MAG: LysR family transcriptional regulator [Rhodobacteraceae bacterium]|nr:LysR family transcriptional regulator [Paracoccaceae bacterium]